MSKRKALENEREREREGGREKKKEQIKAEGAEETDNAPVSVGEIDIVGNLFSGSADGATSIEQEEVGNDGADSEGERGFGTSRNSPDKDPCRLPPRPELRS